MIATNAKRTKIVNVPPVTLAVSINTFSRDSVRSK